MLFARSYFSAAGAIWAAGAFPASGAVSAAGAFPASGAVSSAGANPTASPSRAAFGSFFFAIAMLAGCGPPTPVQPKSAQPELRIAATERGPRGARLVFLAPDGRRVAELTQTTAVAALDTNPAWSPDGSFVAFASSRGQKTLLATKLWIVPTKLEGGRPAPPTPLWPGAPSSIERDPRWLASSKALIFASDQGGSLDLYRLSLIASNASMVAAGQPVRLTDDKNQNLSPSISADGKQVAFMSIASAEDGKSDGDSKIRVLSLERSSIRDLTDGPVDVTPAFNPEQPDVLAYAARANGRNDMDIVVVDLKTNERRNVPEVPIADLTGPVWSIDGRHLFATAVFRSVASGNAILSSVVVLDTKAQEPEWLALHDPAYTESRIGVALAPRVFLPSEINVNQPYAEALKLAIEQHLIREQEDRRDRSRKN